MRFDDRFLEEIKARIRPSEVIGRSVKLRRQGREWVGLSPFNQEKTPSFYVNDEKNFWHDFSSGKSGDVITFLQETERLSFPEAVERLAADAGLALPAADPRAAEQVRRQQGLADWLELAAAWFEAELRRPGGQGARAYLAKRGLPEADWPRFRLGYAPAGRTALKDYLVAKGASPADLAEAGLLIAPEGGGAPYDRFRDRIIFPIADGRGRLVSFGGRALNPEDKAKYLNGPETGLFHKGRNLYGLHEARKLVASGGDDASLVVVEGYFDVIACHRSGIAAVAPMGTALTEEQMALLWRLHPEPTLCFDADAAGLRAASKAVDRALPLLQPGRSFRFALISGGKDPDDVLREQGPAALKAQLGETKPFVQQLFERERELEPLDTPERRAGLKVRLRKLAAGIADPDLAAAYKQTLLQAYEDLWPARAPAATRADFGRALQSFRTRGPRGIRPAFESAALPETREAAERLHQAYEPLAAALVEAVLRAPDLLDEQLEIVTVQGFGAAELDAVVQEVVAYRFSTDAPDPERLSKRLFEQGRGVVMDRIARSARLAKAPFLEASTGPAERLEGWNRAFDVLRRQMALDRAVQQAKGDLAADPDSTAYRRLKAERDAHRRAMKSGELLATH